MTDDDDYTAFLVAEERARDERVAAAERDRIVHLLRDNYGPDYGGAVNLDAVLRIIGGAS